MDLKKSDSHYKNNKNNTPLVVCHLMEFSNQVFLLVRGFLAPTTVQNLFFQRKKSSIKIQDTRWASQMISPPY